MLIRGRAHIFGDNIPADYIISAKYLGLADIKAMIPHFFEDLRPGFHREIQPSDIIVAGENFGSGSSREHAPLLIKEAGIGCVVAKSFARSFFRNAINQGIPLVEIKWEEIDSLDALEIELGQGYCKNCTKNTVTRITPLSSIMMSILSEGGLIQYFKKHGKYCV